MSSVQERLQLKRVPLDTWNIREQLCLASAVVRSGDQNWMSVSRALKTVGDPNRPTDWYSQKSCAAQYGTLLEQVEAPKRKKRNSEGGVETPQESILNRLTQERIVEIQKSLDEMCQQYEVIKVEMSEVTNPGTSDDRIKELWTNVEVSKKAKEREQIRRAAWLREREERKARAERSWRPSIIPVTASSTAVTPSSPLLTSLLKSSPVVTTPQHIPHPASVVDTISPSAGAPTLSMLLEKPTSSSSLPTPTSSVSVLTVPSVVTSHQNKHAAIEQIKNQLQEIEHRLKAASSSGAASGTQSPVSLVPAVVPLSERPVPSLPEPPAASGDKIDIDDIEIKAEDVYAFSDIDIEIPPVSTMHKNNGPRMEKPIAEKNECDIPDVALGDIREGNLQEAKVVHDVTERTDAVQEQMEKPPEVKISFPEVKFPNTEIKVIQDELRIKEEPKEPETKFKEKEAEIIETPPTDDSTSTDLIDEESVNNIEETPEPVEELIKRLPDPEDIPLPPEDPPPMEKIVDETGPSEETVLDYPEKPVPDNPEEPLDDQKDETTRESSEEASEEREELNIKEEFNEDDVSIAENTEMDMEKKDDVHQELVKEEERPSEPEETHTETDDDTPMELIREEDKGGKKRRDYSRKKKTDSSRTYSGSESAPESPAMTSQGSAANDAERDYRLWKKSVLLVYSRLCAHKYASLFLRPITDDQAPGYSIVIRRPMDLTTIRRNIDGGAIKTTAQFQRDVLLMLSNALMYNSSEHRVYHMAKEMHQEAEAQLGMLLQAQAHASLSDSAPPARRAPPKRRAQPLTPTSTPPMKRRNDE